MIPSSSHLTAPSSSSSSTLAPAARDPDARPRNRRLVARGTTESSFSSPGQSPTRDASPIPAARIGSVTGRNDSSNEVARSRRKSPAASGGFFQTSWTPSWASVTELASSLLPGASGNGSESGWGSSREVSQTRGPKRQSSYRDVSARRKDNWGPEPPTEARPRLQDVAAGSMAEREAALRAMRTASVLESHEGVNGGLDITGKFKKRNSDEILPGSAVREEIEEHLVYIHHVQPSDTYAGIVLKYKCREDAFRKANGLWSRDGIQVRKWLALPVDACEIRGRPCDGPTASGKVDLLARTPEETDPFGGPPATATGDFFTHSQSNGYLEPSEDRPWTHVRWVSIDSCPHPVEIARVPRKALGYFPPRRKKSVHTVSTLSTPRGSLDVPSIPEALGSPASGSVSSRRPSLLSSTARPQLGSNTRARVGSVGATGEDQLKPAWMRRPGGVGSLNKSVRAPGPEKDYFNSWTKKHLPGLTMDSLPSMSVMGSERARLGFAGDSNVAIVESPFEDGRSASSAATGGAANGTGLDKAAQAIETWLRGAFAKRPGTPISGPKGRTEEGDLIELVEGASDDGRGGNGNLGDVSGLLGTEVFGPVGTGWNVGGEGSVRGRTGTRNPREQRGKSD
ncbi:hypothetical protein OQA88_12754 [Cercophora sp. LCS_1]